MDEGLDKVAAQTPVGTGYVEALAGATQDGAFGRLEAGLHPLQDVDLFAYGEAATDTGFGAGLGARWTFNL